VIDVNEKIEIVIYDTNGKTIDQFNLQGVNTIPVGGYSSGKYILKASQSDRVFVGQFIKE
jgi:hypothetical protein